MWFLHHEIQNLIARKLKRWIPPPAIDSRRVFFLRGKTHILSPLRVLLLVVMDEMDAMTMRDGTVTSRTSLMASTALDRLLFTGSERI